MSERRVLITGGAGFIGSNLADRLIKKGDEVFVIDNLATGRLDNVNSSVIFLKGDIADEVVCRDFFEKAKPDFVVHAAASYKDSKAWEEDLRVNAIGTSVVVRNAIAQGVKRIVYFQTSLCYGHHPIEQPITLSHPIQPDNSYAIGKTAGEQMIKMSGLDYVSFRLANCYGPRNLSGPIPTFYHKLSQDQQCFISDARRDFIYVDDLLDVVELALAGVGEKGSYHVATGRDFAIQEVFEIMCDLLGKQHVAQDTAGKYFGRFWDDVKTLLLDPSKTEETFGLTPVVVLRDGISKAVEWYKTHEIVETYTHLKDAKLKC